MNIENNKIIDNNSGKSQNVTVIPVSEDIIIEPSKLYLLKSNNEVCTCCNQPLHFDSKIQTIINSKAIIINGLVCDYCNILYVKDFAFLSEYLNCVRKLKNNSDSSKTVITSYGEQIISKEDDNSIPELSTEKEVYLYSGLLPCHPHHHSIDSYCAHIKGLNNIENGFFVEYCKKCHRFYMNEEDYGKYLQKYKLFPLRASTKFITENHYYDPYDLLRKEQSPLFMNGYSVSASKKIPKAIRQQILSYLMDYGIVSKETVLDYLRMFIRERGSNPSMAIAVSKWEEDKQFVLQYHLDSHPKVNVARLEWKPRR